MHTEPLTITEAPGDSQRSHYGRLNDVHANLAADGTVYYYTPSGLWSYQAIDADVERIPELVPDVADDVMALVLAMRETYQETGPRSRARRIAELREELAALEYEDARNYPARQVVNGAAGLHYLVTLGGLVDAPVWVCCCGQRAYSTTEWDAHVKAVTR